VPGKSVEPIDSARLAGDPELRLSEKSWKSKKAKDLDRANEVQDEDPTDRGARA